MSKLHYVLPTAKLGLNGQKYAVKLNTIHLSWAYLKYLKIKLVFLSNENWREMFN